MLYFEAVSVLDENTECNTIFRSYYEQVDFLFAAFLSFDFWVLLFEPYFRKIQQTFYISYNLNLSPVATISSCDMVTTRKPEKDNCLEKKISSLILHILFFAHQSLQVNN